MEAIKIVLMYGLEIAVISLVGVTLVAGFYQMVRDKLNGRRTTYTAEGSAKS